MYDLWHACCNGDKPALLCYETTWEGATKFASRTGSPQGVKKKAKAK